MATDGMVGLYLETRNYGATAAFWASLGYENVFETDHGSGQWRHPSGGPYLFLAEQLDADLEIHPILWVGDSTAFIPSRTPQYAKPFTPEHWGVVEATVLDPDGRPVSLQAPVPKGVSTPDADEHHAEQKQAGKYG